MAITFSKSISTLKLLNAYNNNVVQFSSDNVLDSVKCSVDIPGLTLPFEITPINNVFEFNYREVISALINTNNFKDEILPTTNLEVDNSLNGSFLVTYTITFSDTSTEQIAETYVFIKSVEQIANVSNRLLSEQQILTPNILTAFKGYPFDIGHYSDGNITITNTSLFVDLTSVSTNTDRIFLSLGDSSLSTVDERVVFEDRVIADGGTYENNPCWITSVSGNILNVGYNNITIIGTTTENLTIKLEDINCGGTYLKWFNNKGSWSYWLFNPIHKEKTTVKTLDSFNVDFESIDNTYATELILGRTATNTRELLGSNLSNDEMLQIKDILVSPRIEMYNGGYGDAVTVDSWQTVKIKSASQIILNTKREFIDFKLTIEINQYTQV